MRLVGRGGIVDGLRRAILSVSAASLVGWTIKFSDSVAVMSRAGQRVRARRHTNLYKVRLCAQVACEEVHIVDQDSAVMHDRLD